MTPLLPLTAHLEALVGYLHRLRWFAGLFYGSCMALFFFVTLQSSQGLVAAVTEALVGGAVGGLFFSYLWTAWIRRGQRKLFIRLHGLDPTIVPQVSATDFNRYLICNQYLSEHRAYGGILFVGPKGVLFQPHRQSQPRSLPAVSIPAAGLTIEPITIQIASWRRYVIARPLEGFRLSWGTESAVFLAPQVPTVIQGLRSALPQHAA
jgi:hypothetical protein